MGCFCSEAALADGAAEAAEGVALWLGALADEGRLGAAFVAGSGAEGNSGAAVT